jgi:uncharacterized membrane protein YbhN (UPF0104 family)
MPRQGRKNGAVFRWCTVLTALGSVAASLMEFLVFLGIGWDYAWFDLLLAVTISSTVGLLVGACFLFAHDPLANIVIVLSCLYIPTAFIALTVEGFTPPAAWWLLLPLGLIEIVFGLLGLRRKLAATDDEV